MHPRTCADGGVEQDPGTNCWTRCFTPGSRRWRRPAARPARVALANQGETVLAWDRGSGRPLSPAIVWQDRRAADICAGLANRRERLAAPHRAGARPLLLRTEDDLAARARHHRRGSHHDRHAGWSTSSPASSSPTPPPPAAPCSLDWTWRLGSRAAQTIRAGRRAAARIVRLATRSSAPRPAFGAPTDGRRAYRRPAGRPARRRLLGARHGQVHLRHRRVPAGQHRHPRGPLGGRADHLGGLAARDQTAYCIDGQVYTAASAVRWINDLGLISHASELDTTAADRPRRRAMRPRPGRAGRALVAPGRHRIVHRHDPGHPAGAPGARRAGGHRRPGRRAGRPRSPPTLASR